MAHPAATATVLVALTLQEAIPAGMGVAVAVAIDARLH
jgi:hypothetical protein